MTPAYYTVSMSGDVAAQFRRLLETARAEGHLRVAVAAGEYIRDELGYEPSRFGESRGHLPRAELAIRLAFARPLCVEFGIHEPSKTVFVRAFGLVP